MAPRIAVFRALQIGDLLVAVPALRALRHSRPDAHITLIGLPWAQDFVRRFGYCDELLVFPGLPGLPEQRANDDALQAFYAEARARRFDLALQMHGSGELTNAVVLRLGARETAGFRPTAHDVPAHFLEWDAREPETDHYLRLVRALGIETCGAHLEFPISVAESRQAAALLARHLPFAQEPYVCIHPGARLPSRRWPAERFAAVADALAALGYGIVLTGTQEEAEVTAAVRDAMRRPAIDLAGRTSLGAFAALLRDARLVVCNDTSTSHIARALRTPAVVISCGADVRRWQPLDHPPHRVLWQNTPCRPCMHAVCPTLHECAQGVRAEAVLDTARRLLDLRQRDAA